MKRDFDQAREFFLKSLKVDSNDALANYELGVMNLLGLGTEKDVQEAVEYFLKAGEDPHSQNALGVIF